LPARTEGALRHFFHDVVAADGFDDFLFGVVAIILVVVVLVAMQVGLFGCGRLATGGFGRRRVIGMGQVFVRVFFVSPRVVRVIFVRVIFVDVLAGLRFRRRSGGRLGGGRIGQRHRRQRLARIDMAMLVMSVFVMGMIVCFMRMIVFVPIMIMMLGIVVPGVMGLVVVRLVGMEMPFFAMDMIVGVIVGLMLVVMPVRPAGLGLIRARSLNHLAADAVAIAATAGVAVARAAAVGAVLALFFGFAMGAFVGFDQRLPVGDRNLIIVRMDFAEGQKTVTVAAVLDEGRLQRRLYARDLGEIDIAAQLFALGGLEIKLFDAIAADHDNPGLFRVGSIDQHFVGHFGTLDGGGRVQPGAHMARPGDATVHLIRG
jgi:hypothetical protein